MQISLFTLGVSYHSKSLRIFDVLFTQVIENLEKLRRLHTLNLAHNSIEKLERLDTLLKLKDLDVSHNEIYKIEGKPR